MGSVTTTALLVLGVALMNASCTHLKAKSESSFDVGFGTIAPSGIESIPDWTMDLVRSCYAEGLRTDLNQEGEIRFTVIPPETTGPVEATVVSANGLSAELVECIRSSFGTIHHYVDSGRRQLAVSETLSLTRRVEQVCEPPSTKVIKRILASRYEESGVVAVSTINVARLYHAVSEIDADQVQRYVVVDVELVFSREGYEGQCYHGNEYKVFSRAPVEPEGMGHVCTSIHHKKGEKVSDTEFLVFELEDRRWWAWTEEKAYCGDRRSWFSRRY